MVFFSNLNIEYKSALFFSVIGFLLSLLIGFIMGAGMLTVLLRAIVFLVSFGAIGYGIIFVLKKFVPEIYEVISQSGKNEVESEEDESKSDVSAETVTDSGLTEDGADITGKNDKELNDNLSMEQSDVAHIKKSDHLDGSINGSKMGKHVLEEKSIKYEPKIMAEAIRTMLKKDEG